MTPDEFVDAWNAVASRSGWLVCRKMNAARTNQLRLRMKDAFWAENWRDAIEKASGIPGLRGANERGWRANVDWFLRPGTVLKIVEGVYDRWGPPKGVTAKGVTVATVPTAEESARKAAEAREYSRKAVEEWEARGRPSVLPPWMQSKERGGT